LHLRLKPLTAAITAGFIGGLILGLPAGHFFENAAINGRLYFPALCFRPSRNFYDLMSRLNNYDDLVRLTGYYLYRDTGLTDYDFLYDRYRYDGTLLSRKAILWIASSGTDSKKQIEFYGKVFEISDPELQRVITKRVEMLGSETFKNFIIKYNINQKTEH